MSELFNLNLGTMDLLVPYIKILGGVAIGKFLISLLDNWVASRTFRARGFRIHETVKVDEELATITQIGVWATHFRTYDVHDARDEYLAVPNRRLEFLKIKRLVRKYEEDEKE